jgi:hypothetical protein
MVVEAVSEKGVLVVEEKDCWDFVVVVSALCPFGEW